MSLSSDEPFRFRSVEIRHHTTATITKTRKMEEPAPMIAWLVVSSVMPAVAGIATGVGDAEGVGENEGNSDFELEGRATSKYVDVGMENPV